MRKWFLTCLLAGSCAASSVAQTLFTYGGHPVNKDEFVRVYKKNSVGKQADMSDTALRSYLNLYSLFRMKVTEAESEHLDTLPNIQKELESYRKQLSKNYLTDNTVTDKLINEAYERMKKDVHVAHILIKCPPGSDTVAAYRKIDSIYHVLESKGSDFETMAKLYSEDKGTSDKGGDVGYFTALQLVYPFENAMFSTPVGSISAPFRTQFGYHIIKVLDKRDDRGQVKVAQIMIATPKSKGDAGVEAARKRADSIETMLKSGKPFYQLVKQYSEDKFTVNDSGVMKTFGTGKYVAQFENAAFDLKKPGDISAPIKTDDGYHILKLIAKYPLQPRDSLYPQLKHKVENDSRAMVAQEHFFNSIKQKNGFKEYPENLNAVTEKIMSLPDTGKKGRTFKAEDFKQMTLPVFTISSEKYSQHDFVVFLEQLTRGRISGKKNSIHDAYALYVKNKVNEFEENRLANENPEFKNLMQEYRDGIMLFELMDRHVWSKASHDSAGLKDYYAAHKKYMWEPGFKGSVYKFKNDAALNDAKKPLADKSTTDDDLLKVVNTSANPDGVSIQHGRFEFSHFTDIARNQLIAGQTTSPVKNAGGGYTVVKVEEVYANPEEKTLDDARGYVVAEYQDYLEKQFNQKMRDKYPLKVDEKVFKKIVKN
jgi:peptidyl-prolyl cis-trans isomerase SurA